jgi:hypothetical protein
MGFAFLRAGAEIRVMAIIGKPSTAMAYAPKISD